MPVSYYGSWEINQFAADSGMLLNLFHGVRRSRNPQLKRNEYFVGFYQNLWAKKVAKVSNLQNLRTSHRAVHLPVQRTWKKTQIPPPDVARRNNSLPTKLDKEDDVHQVATLLALIGKHANKVFRTSTFSPPDDAEKIELVLSNSKSTAYPGRTPFMNAFFSLPGISVNPKLYIYIYWPVSYKTSSDRSKLWPWVNHIWLASPGSICDRHCKGTWKFANREEVDPWETIR